MNNVSLIGRASSDLLKFMTPAGRPLVKFALAFDSRMKAEDGSKITSFIEIEAWDILAERVYENVIKGDRVGITGHLVQHKFTRKDGTQGSTIKVIMSSVEFLERKRKTEEDKKIEASLEKVDEEDLPSF